MESMKELRSRMISVRKTMKITNAMYLLASSKMKKARKRLLASEPYFNRLQDTIADILVHTHSVNNRYFTGKDTAAGETKRGYVVITSDKGLAGAYNHNVIRLTESHLNDSGNNTFFFIGYSGHNYFAKKPELGKISGEHSYAATEPALYRARSIAEDLVKEFCGGELDEIYLIYTKMRSELTADTEIIKLLPLARDMFPDRRPVITSQADNYEEHYYPSPDAVLDMLVPNYVKGLIYGAMTEAYAGEQNARMIAMDNATKNAKQLIDRLSVQYNRMRQAAITTELSEVAGAAKTQYSQQGGY